MVSKLVQPDTKITVVNLTNDFSQRTEIPYWFRNVLTEVYNKDKHDGYWSFFIIVNRTEKRNGEIGTISSEKPEDFNWNPIYIIFNWEGPSVDCTVDSTARTLVTYDCTSHLYLHT